MKQSYPYSLSFLKGILLPIFLWIGFTPWSAWLDLKMSYAFYENGSFVSHPFWNWLYLYGIWPAWSLIGLALIGLALSFSNAYRSWRKPCIFLLLTFAVGTGLIIHAVLKDNWGRPRPRQVTEFGGKQSFRAYYQPNFGQQPEPSKSFASGHTSVGFYFFALALLGMIYRSRFLYWLGIGVAWGLGSLLSMARIAQGGHFLSDTLASALIMWLTAWVFAYFLFGWPNADDRRRNDERIDT
jgi:membrane-associated PAP2 superfamily phosphatase